MSEGIRKRISLFEPRTVIFVLLGLMMSCYSSSNKAPTITGASEVYFVYGVENILELITEDADGDSVSVTFTVVDGNQQSVGDFEASIQPITDGFLFSWSLGTADEMALQTPLFITFVANDGRDGEARHTVQVNIVDPTVFSSRGLRLQSQLPDGFRVRGDCIEPIRLTLQGQGQAADYRAYLISPETFCESEAGCGPSSREDESGSVSLFWCPSEFSRQQTDEFDTLLRTETQSGRFLFDAPLNFRFLAEEVPACAATKTLSMDILESRTNGSALMLTLRLDSDFTFDAPYIAIGPNESFESATGSINSYLLRSNGDGVWSVRVPLDNAVFSRDDMVIQLSARITDEGCKHLVFSELLQLNQELGVIESDGQLCDRCTGASDCQDGGCMVIDGVGRCASNCEEHQDCPPEFRCIRGFDTDGGIRKQCMPLESTCLEQCAQTVEGRWSGLSRKELKNDMPLTGTICRAQSQGFVLNLAAGKGVSIRTTPENPQTLHLGMSVSRADGAAGVGEQGEETGSFVLRCTDEAVRLYVDIWSWFGEGEYSIETQNVVGCGRECFSDRLDEFTEGVLVEETTDFDNLSLCDHDVDVFTVDMSDTAGWTLSVGNAAGAQALRARLLHRQSQQVKMDVVIQVGMALDLSSDLGGLHNLILTPSVPSEITDYQITLTLRDNGSTPAD